MADSIRKQIYDKVIARMQTIKPATFETSIGLNVGEAGNIIPEGVEAMIVYDRGRDASYEDGVITKQDNNIRVEIVVTGLGDVSQTRIYKMLADIEKAIGTTTDGKSGETWSGLAIHTLIESDDIEVNHEDRKIAEAIFRFTIFYRTARHDPYN